MASRLLISVTLLFLFFGFSSDSLCATWYVDASVSSPGDGTSWGTAFKTIQQGIDAVSHGDTVIVAEGTYVENIRFKGKNIVLTSTDPLNAAIVEKTIINGGKAGSVVTFAGAEEETCVLCGFTIQNGLAGDGAGICGGGSDQHTHATIQNNVVADNAANKDLPEAVGGGLAYCDGRIRNNTITGNWAYHGGGLFECDGLIQGNTITGNSAGYGGGGGLYGCGGTIQNNIISSNSGGGSGGGLCLCGGMIRDNTISGNFASPGGGGLSSCHGIIQNNKIHNNSSGYSNGGGLNWCQGTIQNNLIYANSADDYGGGLYYCHGTIQNNTIYGNSAGNDAAGLGWCHGTIRNCIIWQNTAANSGNQIYSCSSPFFCCVQDWSAGGAGNIDSDPLFLDAENGDLHLQSDSPCINAGANDYWVTWPQRDLDGNCRMAGARVDMGCYEYGSSLDSDGDLLSDSEETAAGTDAFAEDSDGDGLRDGLERIRSSNPLNPTLPTSIHVPLGMSTIQGALSLSMNGDEIIVAPGTYPENLQFSGTDVILRSGDPENPHVVASTIIDGGGAGSVIMLTGNETRACVISGFTLRNGKATWGAGINGGTRQRLTHAVIENNVITANQAGFQEGGSIYGNGASVAHCNGPIRFNRISANVATGDGGGLYYCGGVIAHNVISGNSANSGGGLYFCNGIVQDNVIVGNSANDDGGGLFSCGGTIRNNTICANDCRSQGGGLYSCQGTIENNIISGNQGGSTGGGLWDCNGRIQNNLISGNWAYREGAGWGDGGGLDTCRGTIQNNTICGNSSGATGGVAHCGGAVRNCIIWGNSGRQLRYATLAKDPTPAYSCVQDWTGGGEGTITENPLFIGAPLQAGQWNEEPTFDEETCQTTLVDTSAVWEAGTLKGLLINPNTTQPPQFLIASNSSTTIIVWGDASGLVHAGNAYEIYDYRLDPASACVDAGDNTIVAGRFDLDGNDRRVCTKGQLSWIGEVARIEKEQGGAIAILWKAFIDMGAYECQVEGPVPETFTVQTRDRMESGGWIEVFSGNFGKWTDEQPTGTQKFYRIEMK